MKILKTEFKSGNLKVRHRTLKMLNKNPEIF